ncbi:hypothetical protein COOONC_23183 [Cooperia oncophora]
MSASTTRFAIDYAKRVASCKKCKIATAERGWDDVKDEDKEPILKLIDDLNKVRAKKEGGAAKGTPEKESGGYWKEANEESKYNSFHKFTKLCEVIASVSKYTDKSSAVKMFISRDDFDGDILTLVRLLIPGVDQRVYNIKEKQIIKHFATVSKIYSFFKPIIWELPCASSWVLFCCGCEGSTGIRYLIWMALL